MLGLSFAGSMPSVMQSSIESLPPTIVVNLPTTNLVVKITLAGMEGTIDWGDGTTKTITATSTAHTKTFAEVGIFAIKLLGDISTLTNFTMSGGSGNNYVQSSIINFSKMVNLTTFNVGLDSSKLGGDIMCLKNLIHLTYYRCRGTLVTGDIQVLKNMTSLLQYWGQFGDYGDIGVFSDKVGMTTLSANAARLKGNISALKNLTNLTYLTIASATPLENLEWKLEGSLLELSQLTKLTSISAFTQPLIKGDLDVLYYLPLLTQMNINGVSDCSFYGTTPLPAFGGEFYLYLATWESFEHLDRFIIALAPNAKSTGTRKLHAIGLSNVFRTAASDDAVALLVSKGWQIIINREA